MVHEEEDRSFCFNRLHDAWADAAARARSLVDAAARANLGLGRVRLLPREPTNGGQKHQDLVKDCKTTCFVKLGKTLELLVL